MDSHGWAHLFIPKILVLIAMFLTMDDQIKLKTECGFFDEPKVGTYIFLLVQKLQLKTNKLFDKYEVFENRSIKYGQFEFNESRGFCFWFALKQFQSNMVAISLF